MNMNVISGKTLPRRRGVLRLAACVWLGGAPLTLPAAVNDAMDIRRDATVIAVEQVMPTVVNIATKSIVPVRDPFEQVYRQAWHQQPYDVYYSLGSGVVIDEAGFLLTNDHVVRRASQIAVRFGTGTNEYEATLVVSDEKADVALLKLKARPGERFRAIRFAREDDLLLGETVLALGNPLGLGGSVTRGILSSKSRSAPVEGGKLTYQNWLQTDAPINGGNSGGPLVNLRGELIGINVAVVNETPQGEPVQGIGFAIPIRLVEQALSDILPTEFVKSLWFGARVKIGTSPLVITSVQPESPAGRAGLKTGDLVLGINGRAIRSFIDFVELLTSNPRADVQLTIQRGAQQSNCAVKLVPEASVFNPDLIRDRLGATLEPRTIPVMSRQLQAFLITDVQKGGPADTARMKKGLWITTVDGQTPENLTVLAKQLYAKKKGDTVALTGFALQQEGNFGVSLPKWIAQVTLRQP
jgi:S1-C subfamily serine protease